MINCLNGYWTNMEHDDLDSNTVASTIYPSFSTLRALRIIDPEKELSIILAHINFAIDELPYPPNKIPLDFLIDSLTRLQSIADDDSALVREFTGFCRVRFDKIIRDILIASIFTSGHDCLPENDSLLKTEKLLALIFRPTDSLSECPCKSFVSGKVAMELLGCLKSTQISLLQQIDMGPKSDYAADSTGNSGKEIDSPKQPIVSYDSKKQYDHIYLKLVLVNRMLTLVEETCSPSLEIFNFFLGLTKFDLVITKSAFCSELNLVMDHLIQIVDKNEKNDESFCTELVQIKHCVKLIITRIHMNPQVHLESDREFSRLLTLYILIFQKRNFAPIAKTTRRSINSSKKTVVKLSRKQHEINNQNYKYHLFKSPKEPEWVKNFGEINPYDESTEIDINIQNHSSYILNTNQLKHVPRRGLRAKIKEIIPVSIGIRRIFRSKEGSTHCRKCKFIPWHHLYHKPVTRIYIE